MKKNLGNGFAALILIGAITFEMLESLNFWTIAFPADKWYLAYLGFFLTSIAMLGYFYEFIYTAVGRTQKTVALVMAVVCGIGALLTAGVGFQITSYAANGYTFTESDLAYMALIIQGLIAAHIIAMFVYYGGDAIKDAWKDDDGDGIPNFADRHDNRKDKQQQKPMAVNALEIELAELRKENAALKENAPKAQGGK